MQKIGLLFLVLAQPLGAVVSQKDMDRIDSADVTALTGTVLKGRVVVSAGKEAHAALFAKEQLYYLVGHLNGLRGGADMSRAVITLTGKRPKGSRVEFSYEAKFTVAWPMGSSFPTTLRSVVPLSSEDSGKSAFFRAYGSRCTSPFEEAGASSFFYTYRPQKKGCPVLRGYDKAIATSISVGLEKSPLQTTGKFPEYEKVWEDNRLEATFLFGTYADGATADSDEGVKSYNAVYRALRNRFGTPETSNVNLGASENPGLGNSDIEMGFSLNEERKLNIVLLLNQKSALLKPSAAFLARYEARTEISDLISYNGHSGLGANIQGLASLGKFMPGKYQLFFVNGCDTFTYFDDTLEKAHGAVNPGSTPSKHLDVILNAMPSPFDGYSTNTLALLNSLLEGKATYRDMLSDFVSFQRALVINEEDNQFPAPF